MSIKIENTFSLNGKTSNFCMKCNGETTVALLGIITVRPTSNRAGPPDCGNGFETAELPFAKGHIMALELGGSDKKYNVVPQFEDWQGKLNGPWRQMEVELLKHHGKLMLVEIGYGRTGIEKSRAVHKIDFDDNRLMDWTDPRIPDEFKVRVWPATGANPSTFASSTEFDNAVINLKKNATTYSKDLILGEALPEPDRSMYVVQEGVKIFEDLLEQYENDYEEPMSPMSFGMLEDTIDDVREGLGEIDDITPVEATGFQLMPLLMAYQKITPAQLEKKRKRRSQEGNKMISEKKLNASYYKKTKK